MFKKRNEQMQFLLDCGAKFRRYYRIWIGFFSPIIFLNHPDTIKVLMKTAGNVFTSPLITNATRLMKDTFDENTGLDGHF